MRIFIIGQCTLHWGRMEFGNIGNYYIIEPFVRELHRVFPSAEIVTTLQMSDEFCARERISVLPMEYYYGWTGNDLEIALRELEAAKHFASTGSLPLRTPYIEEVLRSDLVIDFSGDIWGANADFLGPDRFHVGLIKDRVAQLLGRPTVMLAGSPGPFNDQTTLEFAREVFSGFDLVTNRESVSTSLLAEWGFDTSKVHSLACPAFLFEPTSDVDSEVLNEITGSGERPVAGFIICGWNFLEGPFDKWPRNDSDYDIFASAVEFMTEKLGLRVVLMSHSNGFPIPPRPFELHHGRDYPIAVQLAEVLTKRGVSKDVHVLHGVYDAWQTKAIIGRFDMLVSGRVHAAVAGLSQHVPTVIIDYGHEPKAHKLAGFADIAGVREYVADPGDPEEIRGRIESCWTRRNELREHLILRMEDVRRLARRNFELLPRVIEEYAVR